LKLIGGTFATKLTLGLQFPCEARLASPAEDGGTIRLDLGGHFLIGKALQQKFDRNLLSFA